MNILIIGVNGFIGNELTQFILANSDWNVHGLDLYQDRLEGVLGSRQFNFKQGDVNKEKTWVLKKIEQCDVVIPLSAIATPMSYVDNPLSVFESVFETNLWIIKACAKLNRRIIFPSTSEVYGMSNDEQFQEHDSLLVQGPIYKQRWIYSCSKQLLDRVIWAYGQQGLPFTIFRPFNWIGCSQDNVDSAKGQSRVLIEFLGNILRNEPLVLVDGGAQQRSFTDISDGIRALMRIIENPNDRANGKIFNIGNPNNNVSIKELAHTLVQSMKRIPEFQQHASRVEFKSIDALEYYGSSYQDVKNRVPDISEIQRCLSWQPLVSLQTSIDQIVDDFAYQSNAQQQVIAL